MNIEYVTDITAMALVDQRSIPSIISVHGSSHTLEKKVTGNEVSGRRVEEFTIVKRIRGFA